MPKISDNRIVCPVNAWRYFTGQRTNPGCSRVACCFECSKEDCIGGSGCSPIRQEVDDPGWPNACRSYPLTFSEAKRIFTFSGIFNQKWAENPSMGYVYFAQEVKVYVSAKKEKIKRKK